MSKTVQYIQYQLKMHSDLHCLGGSHQLQYMQDAEVADESYDEP